MKVGNVSPRRFTVGPVGEKGFSKVRLSFEVSASSIKNLPQSLAPFVEVSATTPALPGVLSLRWQLDPKFPGECSDVASNFATVTKKDLVRKRDGATTMAGSFSLAMNTIGALSADAEPGTLEELAEIIFDAQQFPR